FKVRPQVVTIPGTATATLSVFDVFGNAVELESDDVSLELPAGVSQSGSMTQVQDGFGNPTGDYTWTLTSSRPGQYVILAKVKLADGSSVTKDDNVTWQYDAVGEVELSVSPDSFGVSDAAGAGVTATVTVTAANGQKVAGLTAGDFDFTSAPTGVQVVGSSFQELGSGSYSWQIHAVKAARYTLTVTQGGQSDDAVVTFKAGRPTAATVDWAVSPASVQLPNAATGLLTVTDEFLNPVTDLTEADIVIGQTPGGLAVTGPVQRADGEGRPTGVYAYSLSAYG
ncbi:MAG: hypothetical protein LBH76_09400, partial [Propionibacteriaceae bacterium]|nr:hypothetical protein [Propionibacteriaceae bacterium]